MAEAGPHDLLQGMILEAPKESSLRAILLISSSTGRATPQQLVAAVRGQPGVRHVEAMRFHSAFSRREGTLAKPDWDPTGALVFIEASDAKGFQTSIEAVWAAAISVGTRMIRMSPIDNV